MTAMTIPTVGHNFFRDNPKGTNNPIISYFAVGTGSTSPSAGDTTLQTEVFRKAVTSYTNGATGEILINVYLAPGDAVGVSIAEVGVFGGASATTTVNSGVLIGRALYSHPNKLATESIQLQLDLTFS